MAVCVMAGSVMAIPVIARVRAALLSLSFAILIAVGLAGPSAAKPPLGQRGWAPGTFDWQLSPSAVSVMLYVAYIAGGAGVVLALRWPPRRRFGWAPVLLLGVLALLTSPFGSADHVNYAAYGRIAAQGGDPYFQSPIAWHGGLDPVTASVQPPWQDTPSIYGPFATTLQALASFVGGQNLRVTVWIWQLLIVVAWLGCRWALLRLTPEHRDRIDALWTFNPVVFGILVLGAHVDLIAGMLVVAAILAARRSALAAGLLVGAAFTTKVTYAVVGLALAWAWWQVDRRRIGATGRWVLPSRLWSMTGGALLVIVPSYLIAGPHVLHQLGAAGGSFSYASPWSLLIRLLRVLGLPEWFVTVVVFVLAAAAMVLLAAGLWAVIRRHGLADGIADERTRHAVVMTFALSTSFAVLAPYTLPWYDATTWLLLPMLAGFSWDAVLVARGVVMALAYVPGRATGLDQATENWTLGFRVNGAPYLAWLIAALLGWWGWRARAELQRRPHFWNAAQRESAE